MRAIRPQKKRKTIFAVDPGLGGLGYAHFSGEGLPTAACIYDRSDKPWQQRAENIARTLGEKISEYQPDLVVCEEMQYEDSERGKMAAKNGLMLKTCYLIGCIGWYCYERGIPFELIPVRVWKGQVDKPKIIERICRDLPCVPNQYTSHAWDAVGMGEFVRRRIAAEIAAKNK